MSGLNCQKAPKQAHCSVAAASTARALVDVLIVCSKLSVLCTRRLQVASKPSMVTHPDLQKSQACQTTWSKADVRQATPGTAVVHACSCRMRVVVATSLCLSSRAGEQTPLGVGLGWQHQKADGMFWAFDWDRTFSGHDCTISASTSIVCKNTGGNHAMMRVRGGEKDSAPIDVQPVV